jgi:hypothetical protein
MFLFVFFGGMWGEISCNVFTPLSIVLWVHIYAKLFRRAVLMLWHAFLFLGLRVFPLFFFSFGGASAAFS